MDLIIEIVLDVLGEILFSKGEKTLENSKTPKTVRFLVLSLLILFFALAAGALVWGGVTCIKDDNAVVGVILLAFAVVGITYMSIRIYKWSKAVRKRVNDSSEE